MIIVFCHCYLWIMLALNNFSALISSKKNITYLSHWRCYVIMLGEKDTFFFFKITVRPVPLYSPVTVRHVIFTFFMCHKCRFWCSGRTTPRAEYIEKLTWLLSQLHWYCADAGPDIWIITHWHCPGPWLTVGTYDINQMLLLERSECVS